VKVKHRDSECNIFDASLLFCRRKNSKLPRSPLQPIAEGFQVLSPAEKRTIAAEARALVLQTVFGWISRKVVLQSGGVQNALLEFIVVKAIYVQQKGIAIGIDAACGHNQSFQVHLLSSYERRKGH
jgi:hypothetical protein